MDGRDGKKEEQAPFKVEAWLMVEREPRLKG